MTQLLSLEPESIAAPNPPYQAQSAACVSPSAMLSLPQLSKAISYLPVKLRRLSESCSTQNIFLLTIRNILVRQLMRLGSWHTMKRILESVRREQTASKTSYAKKASPGSTERAPDAETPGNDATARMFAIAAVDSAVSAFGLALSAGQKNWFVTTLSLARTARYQRRSAFDPLQRTLPLDAHISVTTSL
jgi:hypothetical protein